MKTEPLVQSQAFAESHDFYCAFTALTVGVVFGVPYYNRTVSAFGTWLERDRMRLPFAKLPRLTVEPFFIVSSSICSSVGAIVV